MILGQQQVNVHWSKILIARPKHVGTSIHV